MRKINIKNVSEELSTDAYYEKISKLAKSSINLEKEFGLPTSQDELSTLIKNWFDYQDYSDDEQAFDYAMAYYLSEYGNDNMFRNALDDVIDNMEANGYTEIYERRRKLSENIRNMKNSNSKNSKIFEKMRNKRKNKKVTYRVNESSQCKRFKRLPMFENYLEEKYDSVKLLDGHKYVLTDDVVAEDGQTLAKKGDTVTYEDVIGVFTNNATEFTTDCGVFRTEDGQALQPEILMSQNLLSDPQSKMTEDPKAFMTEVVAECRKVGQKLGKAAAARKKIYESLTDEQRKRYQAKKDKLTSEQIEKYNKEIDDMEAKAQKLYSDMEAGKITQEEMMQKTDRLTKSALEKYRTVTGGEDPAWYEDYMDEPGFGKVNESEDDEYTREDYENDLGGYLISLPYEKVKAYKKINAKLTSEEIKELQQKFTKLEHDSVDLDDKLADGEITEEDYDKSRGNLIKKSLKVFRKLTGGCDPDWYDPDEMGDFDPDLNSSVNEDSEEATETEVKDVIDDDILTPETVEAVLTADDDVKDETVTAVVDAVKDDAKEGEEISLDDVVDDVVDATVDAKLSKEDANAVIDAVVDTVINQKVEEETVNESKKRSLKKAVKESLRKKFRKGVFEARVRKIRNKKK